jgi:hypothetical protein
VTHLEAIQMALGAGRGVQVGSGVSEGLAAFVASLAGICRTPYDRAMLVLLSEHRAIQAGFAVLLFCYAVAIYFRSAAISQRLRPQRTRRAIQ